jgi:hypothetical protein
LSHKQFRKSIVHDVVHELSDDNIVSRAMRFSWLLLALAVGCSKWGDPVPGTKGSGDLVAFVLKCASNRGGHPVTGNIPSIQAEWTLQANLVEDMIFVPGDHIDGIQSFLTRAFGKLDPGKGSLVLTTNKWGVRSGDYSVQQTGVSLQYTGDRTQTVICIIGRSKP